MSELEPLEEAQGLSGEVTRAHLVLDQRPFGREQARALGASEPSGGRKGQEGSGAQAGAAGAALAV